MRGTLGGIRGIVVTVVTLAVLAAGPASASGAAEPSLFPLGARATWKLADENGSELRIRSTRSAPAYVLHGFPGFSALRIRAAGRDVQAWDARAAGWKPFLRLGAAAGARYRVDLSASPFWRAVDVTVSRTSCHVGTRTVPGCVTLDVRALKPIADAGVERLVFAPGIGPVEVVVQTIAGPRSYSLGKTGPSPS